MTTPIDLGAMRYPEAVMVGMALCYEKFKKYPIRLRAPYYVLAYMMLSDSRWIEFFEDENGAFLMIVTPVGRVQVVTDHSLAHGSGVFEFRDSPEKVPVYLAQ